MGCGCAAAGCSGAAANWFGICTGRTIGAGVSIGCVCAAFWSCSGVLTSSGLMPRVALAGPGALLIAESAPWRSALAPGSELMSKPILACAGLAAGAAISAVGSESGKASVAAGAVGSGCGAFSAGGNARAERLMVLPTGFALSLPTFGASANVGVSSGGIWKVIAGVSCFCGSAGSVCWTS